jgi:protein-tyrosine phosphatase
MVGSRTGLVLKAWAMRTYELNERQAHQWLSERWQRYEDYQSSFVDLLREQWNQSTIAS